MATSPNLIEGNVHLCAFADRHLTDHYVGWLNDASRMRYSEQRHRTHTRQSCQDFVKSFEVGTNLLWAIEAVDLDNMHIGNIVSSLNLENGLADISIMVGAPEASGRGYGTSAWRAVVKYLENHPAVRKITGGCMASNLAMKAIMKSCKMQPDGVRQNHYLLDGQPVDIEYYAKFQN